MAGGGGWMGTGQGVTPAGDRDARGHLPGTEPGGGFYGGRGYFGV